LTLAAKNLNYYTNYYLNHGFIMKFNKLFLSLAVIFSLSSMPAVTKAESLFPALSKGGSVVKDARGNCVRTKWTADQCCDPCGFAAPAPAPLPQIAEREKIITYVDLVRQSIYFNIDKDNIDAVDNSRIDDVIAEIKKSKSIRDAKIVGYADRFASREYNIDLSKRRATNVLNNFRNKGFLNDVTVGFGFFGKEKPVTDCPTNVPVPEQVACLQADRRVDIELELVRERVERISEVVNNADLAPQYPKPGTNAVEVFSRPINAVDLQKNIDDAVAPSNNMQLPATPASQNQFQMMQQMNSDTPAVPVPAVQFENTSPVNLDALKN
jgi:outer membrane protein OmpA-like peptidoglycan-associated protein